MTRSMKRDHVGGLKLKPSETRVLHRCRRGDILHHRGRRPIICLCWVWARRWLPLPAGAIVSRTVSFVLWRRGAPFSWHGAPFAWCGAFLGVGAKLLVIEAFVGGAFRRRRFRRSLSKGRDAFGVAGATPRNGDGERRRLNQSTIDIEELVHFSGEGVEGGCQRPKNGPWLRW